MAANATIDDLNYEHREGEIPFSNSVTQRLVQSIAVNSEMMKYNEIIETDEPLKHSVLCYWQMIGEVDFFEGINSRHIPKGQNILIFNFGNPIKYQGKVQNYLSTPSFIIVPALKSSLVFNQKGKIDLFGISFIGDGFYKLIQKPIPKLIDRFPERLKSKFEILFLKLEGLSFIEKKGIAKTFILDNMNQDINSNILNRAIGIIETSKGVIKVNEIAGQIKVSERQIQRLFMTRIGITPKDYCKIVRVNNYLDFVLTQSNPIDWMDFVVKYNYHDQPHLINELKSISKLSPGKLLSYRDTLYDRFTF